MSKMFCFVVKFIEFSFRYFLTFSMLFRSFFDLFSISFFDVLSFYIMSFLYFCFSMFCRSMFCNRPKEKYMYFIIDNLLLNTNTMHFLKRIILAWEFVTRSCLKPQNPCSNHEIHVLFEHGFYLNKPKLGHDLHAWRYIGMRCGRDWSFCRCFRSRKRCTRIYDVVAT